MHIKINKIIVLCSSALILLLCSCRAPMEIEWYPDGQMKSIKYYRPGDNVFKIFCYDSGTHQEFNSRSSNDTRSNNIESSNQK